MLIIVAFDLPTETKEQRRAYRVFKKETLERKGFITLQRSVFYRWCCSGDKAAALKKYICQNIPREGEVMCMTLPDGVADNMLFFQNASQNQKNLMISGINIF